MTERIQIGVCIWVLVFTWTWIIVELSSRKTEEEREIDAPKQEEVQIPDDTTSLEKRNFFIVIPYRWIPVYNHLGLFQWASQEAHAMCPDGASWTAPDHMLVMVHCDQILFQKIISAIRRTVDIFSTRHVDIEYYVAGEAMTI